ncbi:flavin reductase [Paractinoplanes abujensis]|uniref:Flavin reductase (DIM6/NTAB) family NADH-FMN oxidoreductase RutF n=1 Tax=Paractinoplanes abujensis TaxID=882441 RepID=A0A7W7CN60_9ACTN|nr:flavin reductase family protein [Actinoplanes abujensis]MBB4689856.1 flavin reductase (DIM6/NTAB) family NADH-FMN oxidoreductase RutF [Actinoplanes abujensis]GID24739.1 flavin reductase [Actinoplanes abujensis]
MHVVPGLKVLYFGTPVVLLSTVNEDGTANLAPMSSAWWLGQTAILGMGDRSRTAANLLREREVVLNLPSSALAGAVDRIAMTTGRPDVPAGKAAQGYRFVADKFVLGGLTEQASDLVAPPRVAECPIQLEGRVAGTHRLAAGGATTYEIEILRTHVEEDLLVPGTAHIDPLRWDPLVMKFCEFFGGGINLHPSRLAEGWQMPALRAACAVSTGRTGSP